MVGGCMGEGKKREGESVRNFLRPSTHGVYVLSLLQHGRVLTECSKMLLNVPITLPSYFFVALQRTTVKVITLKPHPQTFRVRINKIAYCMHVM